MKNQWLRFSIASLLFCSLANAQQQPNTVTITKSTSGSTPKMKQLEKGSYLGIATTPANPAMREQLKLKPGIGLVVEHIDKDSPAEQAGVKQYDVLDKLDDQWLISPEQLAVLIRMHQPGEKVNLSLIRQGQPQTLSASLIEKELPPVTVETTAIWNAPGNFTVMKRGTGTVNLSAQPSKSSNVIIDGSGQIKVTSSMGQYILSVTRENGSTHMTATDSAGNSLFDGRLDSEQDWKAMPAEIVSRARQLLYNMKLYPPTTTPVEP